MFIPKGDTEVVKVEIYVSDNSKLSQGFWNIDDNKVVLSSTLYSEFKYCNTQQLQKKFFDQLKKISKRLLQ